MTTPCTKLVVSRKTTECSLDNHPLKLLRDDIGKLLYTTSKEAKIKLTITHFKKDLESSEQEQFLSGCIHKFFVDIFEFDFTTSRQLINQAKTIISKIRNSDKKSFIEKIFIIDARSFFMNVDGMDFFHDLFENQTDFESTVTNFDTILDELQKSGEFETLKERIAITIGNFIQQLSIKFQSSQNDMEFLLDTTFGEIFQSIFNESIGILVKNHSEKNDGESLLRYLNTMYSYYGYVLLVYSSIIHSNIHNIVKNETKLNNKFILQFIHGLGHYIKYIQHILDEKSDMLICKTKTLAICLTNLNVIKNFLNHILTLNNINVNFVYQNTSKGINNINDEINDLFNTFGKKLEEKDIIIQNKIIENFLLKMGGITLTQDKKIDIKCLLKNEISTSNSFVNLLRLFNAKINTKLDLNGEKIVENEILKICADIHIYNDNALIRECALLILNLIAKDKFKQENKIEEAKGKIKEDINKSFRLILTGPDWKINLKDIIQILKKNISLLTGQTYDERNVNFKILLESDNSIGQKHTQRHLFEENDLIFHNIAKTLEDITQDTEKYGLKIQPIFEKSDPTSIKGYITNFPDLGDILIVPFNYTNFEKKEKKGFLLTKFTFGKDIKNNFYLKDNGDLGNILLLIQNRNEQIKKIFWIANHVLKDLENHHPDTAEHCKRLPIIARLILESISDKPEFAEGFNEIETTANRLDIETKSLLYLSGALHDVGKRNIDLKALDSIKFSEYPLISISSFLNEFMKHGYDGINGCIAESIKTLRGNKLNLSSFYYLISQLQEDKDIIGNIHQGLDKLKTFNRTRKSNLETKEGSISANIFQMDLLNAYKIYLKLKQKYKDELIELNEVFNPIYEKINDNDYEFINTQLEYMGHKGKLPKQNINLVFFSLFIYYSIENEILKEKVKQPHIIDGLNFFREHSELQLLTFCLFHHLEYPTIGAIKEKIGLSIFNFYSADKFNKIKKLGEGAVVPTDLKPFLSIVLTISDIFDALMGSRSYHDPKTLIQKFDWAIGQLQEIKKSTNSNTIKSIIGYLEKNKKFKKQIIEYYSSKKDEVDPSRHNIKIT